MTVPEARTDALVAGQEALGRAAWRDAHACFEEALATSDRPAAWEGLSRAAWWQGDEAATLAARERGHALHWEDPALRGRPLRVRSRRQRLTNDRACALTKSVRLPSAMFASVRCRPHVGSGEGFGTGAPLRAVISSTCAPPDVQCAR